MKTNVKNHPSNHAMPRKGARPKAVRMGSGGTHVVHPKHTAEADRVARKVLPRPGRSRGLAKPPGIKSQVSNS